MKTKKIIFTVGQLGNGGLERQLYYLTKDLILNKIDVSCVCWNLEEDSFYFEKFKNLLKDDLYILDQSQKSLKKVLSLRKIIKKTNPDIVISFTSFVNAATFLSTLGLRCDVIGSLRTSADRYIKDGGLKSFFNILFPRKILVNSRVAKKELEKKLIFRCFSKIQFYGNSVDLKKFSLTDQNIFKEYSISVGNIREAKRIDRLILLFNKLREINLEVKHIHVGGGKDFEKIKQQISNNNLEKHVILIGQNSNILKIAEKASMLLHFSEYEGSPNVIMEAMCMGLPIITTNCGDAKYFIENEKNGFVIDPFDVNIFAEKYIFLHNNKSKREQIGRENMRLIKSFDIDQLGNKFLDSISKFNI
ncbi:Glycosyltransferase involved in cell wall bisynthesis [Belliella buryatensis]|uniref:Glycosyltransferase involved in cell wall bisynthesis n=1 Tax=Belliella buryatensis TaxID=1500549 RepID=A0A239CUP4_9BACT|nr:glycosyltransferase [Belliella buryatensis]SNS23371.1 Glycosyltransferase involved in cell wall bisynthesis [Belliella buryatensis]